MDASNAQTSSGEQVIDRCEKCHCVSHSSDIPCLACDHCEAKQPEKED